jgi:hypothetical protein
MLNCTKAGRSWPQLATLGQDRLHLASSAAPTKFHPSGPCHHKSREQVTNEQEVLISSRFDQMAESTWIDRPTPNCHNRHHQGAIQDVPQLRRCIT